MAKYLLDNLEYLEIFKNDPKTAIITDIDGTISEIAPTPEKAMVTTSMQNELAKLMEKFKIVAVVSGRSALNAREMVGVNGLLYVGNHGMEFLKDGKLSIHPEVEKYIHEIQETGKKLKSGDMSSLEGLIFEDKGICYTIHYRLCSPSENPREKILKTLHDDPECKKFNIAEGRQLVELRPPISCDKGTILNNIIEEYKLEKVIYLGDDITDLDAFDKLTQMENEGKVNGTSILVLSSEIPPYIKKRSTFFVNNVDEVFKFFQWLSN
ncbi:MAG TPA: trehalose-phosphatase [Methanobacterium sp.]|nr:trehalose-phosphatase [Methanobacterium sp.]